MTDWQTHINGLVSHYADMSGIPGAKAHAWFMVNDIARAEPDLYRELPTLLVVEMERRKTVEAD